MIKNDHKLKNIVVESDPFVLYLIVRESLNMGIGKIAAQVGHGVTIIDIEYRNLLRSNSYDLEKINSFRQWEESYYRKIVKRADDKDWDKIKVQLECYLVVDAGFTEIEANSETVIALWPTLRSQTAPIIKRLRLL